jgi:O-antigen ligase
VRVYPHSLYVMVLVNLGVVGLLLCAWTWARATRILLTVPGSAEPAEAGDAQRRTYATLGLAAVGAIAAYGVAYGFEIYSVTLAGICLSGAMLAPTGRSERSRGMVE